MLRNAFPFGQWFILLYLLGGSAAGLLIRWWGVRSRGRTRKWTGTALIFVTVTLVMSQIVIDSLVEWNSAIHDDAMVIGTWSRQGDFWFDLTETITLRADHSCEYRSDEEGFAGRWKRDDWNLLITADGVDSTMRFIKFAGKLRLLSRPPDDPDMWNGNLGLMRDEVVTLRH